MLKLVSNLNVQETLSTLAMITSTFTLFIFSREIIVVPLDGAEMIPSHSSTSFLQVLSWATNCLLHRTQRIPFILILGY